MSGKGVSLEVKDRDVLKVLERITKHTSNMQGLLGAIGNDLSERARLCFHDGRDPYGVPWPKLKIRKGRPLLDTGRLMGSIIYLATHKEVLIGTNVAYAHVHQFGATIRPKRAGCLVFKGTNGPVFAKQVTVPPRPFLPDPQRRGWPRVWQEDLEAAVASHLGLKK